MKTHARLAGVLGIAVWSLAGCAQHATPLDLDVEPIDEDLELVRHARAAVPDAEPLPPRCSSVAERKPLPGPELTLALRVNEKYLP